MSDFSTRKMFDISIAFAIAISLHFPWLNPRIKIDADNTHLNFHVKMYHVQKIYPYKYIVEGLRGSGHNCAPCEEVVSLLLDLRYQILGKKSVGKETA